MAIEGIRMNTSGHTTTEAALSLPQKAKLYLLGRELRGIAAAAWQANPRKLTEQGVTLDLGDYPEEGFFLQMIRLRKYRNDTFLGGAISHSPEIPVFDIRTTIGYSDGEELYGSRQELYQYPQTPDIAQPASREAFDFVRKIHQIMRRAQ